MKHGNRHFKIAACHLAETVGAGGFMAIDVLTSLVQASFKGVTK